MCKNNYLFKYKNKGINIMIFILGLLKNVIKIIK